MNFDGVRKLSDLGGKSKICVQNSKIWNENVKKI